MQASKGIGGTNGIPPPPFEEGEQPHPSHIRQKIMAAKAGVANTSNYGLVSTDSYSAQLTSYQGMSPSINQKLNMGGPNANGDTLKAKKNGPVKALGMSIGSMNGAPALMNGIKGSGGGGGGGGGGAIP
jgi:hypothetical protein